MDSVDVHGFYLFFSPSSINFNHIGLALLGVVHHATSIQHHNTSWLQTLADIYLGECVMFTGEILLL